MGLTFAKNPQVAEQQMVAVIVYLTAFGYIDGDFDLSEKVFVLNYIRELVELRVEEAGPTDAGARVELAAQLTAHYDQVFEQIDGQIRALFDEVVAGDEDQARFVYAKLKLGCFEIFKAFDHENQLQLLEVIDKLIYADGVEHPAEKKFRAELSALLSSEAPLGLEDSDLEPVTVEPLRVGAPVKLAPAEPNHPLLEHLERHYSRDPAKLREQVEFDHDLVTQTVSVWDEQRAAGAGRLDGKRSVAELSGSFLDRHVYVMAPAPGDDIELVVL